MKQKYAMKFGGLNLMDELKKRLPASELITKELLQVKLLYFIIFNFKYLRL